MACPGVTAFAESPVGTAASGHPRSVSVGAIWGVDVEVLGEVRVISGHGEFNVNYLEDGERRTKKPTFVVPKNVTIWAYAPPGAALENDVANLIEEGRYPASDALEMKMKDTAKVVPLLSGYPRTFTAGQEMINYTVAPPGDLTIKGRPVTVTAKESLKSLVDRLVGTVPVTIHYACCSSSYTLNETYRGLLPHYGWYVRLK
jgi:Putative adhesin Stv domain